MSMLSGLWKPLNPQKPCEKCGCGGTENGWTSEWATGTPTIQPRSLSVGGTSSSARSPYDCNEQYQHMENWPLSYNAARSMPRPSSDYGTHAADDESQYTYGPGDDGRSFSDDGEQEIALGLVNGQGSQRRPRNARRQSTAQSLASRLSINRLSVGFPDRSRSKRQLKRQSKVLLDLPQLPDHLRYSEEASMRPRTADDEKQSMAPSTIFPGSPGLPSPYPKPPGDDDVVGWNGPNDPVREATAAGRSIAADIVVGKPHELVTKQEVGLYICARLCDFLRYIRLVGLQPWHGGRGGRIRGFDGSHGAQHSALRARFCFWPGMPSLGRYMGRCPADITQVIWGPMSELYGRKIPLFAGFVIFAIFQVPVAVAQNIETIFICRFLAGFAGCAPLTIVGGALADFWAPVDRGIAVSIFSCATFLGPTGGPIVGGYLVQAGYGWRWSAWVTLVAAGFFGTIGWFVYPESFGPVLLQKRAKKLRYATRNWAIHALADENEITAHAILEKYLTKPIKMLIWEPILLLITVYISFIYGILCE